MIVGKLGVITQTKNEQRKFFNVKSSSLCFPLKVIIDKALSEAVSSLILTTNHYIFLVFSLINTLLSQSLLSFWRSFREATLSCFNLKKFDDRGWWHHQSRDFEKLTKR